jgi:hypothetical protein
MDLAFASNADVRADAVEEQRSCDDDHAAAKLSSASSSAAACSSKVVRRFVEEQHIAPLLEHARRCTRLRSPPERFRPFLLIRSGEVETRNVGARVVWRLPWYHVLAVGNLLPDVLVGIEGIADLIDLRQPDGFTMRMAPVSGVYCR